MPPHETTEADAVFDPLTDILFSAIAVLFVTLIAIAPALRDVVVAPAQAENAASASPSRALYNGQPLALLLATPAGVRLGDTGTTFIPLDILDSDARLLAFLGSRGTRQLALLIEPGGEEASFLLDPILASQRIASVLQMRLVDPCATRDGQIDFNACLAGVAEAVRR